MTVPVQKPQERGVGLRGTAAPQPSAPTLHRPEIPAASITLAKEIVLVALGALRANKMRSFLTMLGIVIGVAAVIAMVAIGKGAQNSISQRIAGLGTTLLTVRPGARRGFGVATEDAQKLTVEDADALVNRGKYFAAVGPEMSKRLLIQ
ncbi:MAG TPA: ABC transporter permease, partial [Gemmatimonadaceae bacterium]|nr:ABC transporter permease [Gemmatimonadaceae bacterium]